MAHKQKLREEQKALKEAATKAGKKGPMGKTLQLQLAQVIQSLCKCSCVCTNYNRSSTEV